MKNLKVVITTLNAKYTHSSLALRYLRENCKDLCDIEIAEFSINHQILDILGQLFEKRPEVLGFACYIWNIEMTKQLIALVRKVLPQTVIVCGGPEVSYDTRAFMEENAAVDYVIRGEGEEAFRALLSGLQSGGAAGLESIAGLAGRNLAGIYENCAVTVADLSSLPFPYQPEEMELLREKIIYYESSRGCPFSCKYCLSCATSGVRYLPLSRVQAEIGFFVKQNVRQIKFVDRTFNAKKEHFLPILRFLAKQQGRTNFHFEIAVDYLDEEVLSVLEQMPPGRIQLEIGIQSTHLPALQAVSRVNHWDMIQNNIRRILRGKNMHVHVDLIFGLPEEDQAAFARSFDDVYALQPDMLQLGFLKFLKGAAMMELVDTYQYVYMDKAPYQVLANATLSYAEVRKFHTFEEIFELYYNSGRLQQTTKYLIDCMGGSAFHFYAALTDFWESREYHKISHAPKALYRHLADFSVEQSGADTALVMELLKLDALLSDHGSIRPDFLPWQALMQSREAEAFWRDGVAEKYMEKYHFQNWRQIHKSYHIERFSFAVDAFVEQDRLMPEEGIWLFVCTGEACTYKKINAEDFSL